MRSNQLRMLCGGVMGACLVLAGCTPTPPSGTGQILLFNGTGTSRGSVAALEKILKERDLNYATVNSDQLNLMSESQLAAFRLLILPGGNYITMGKSLTTNATANVHRAVQGGLNYLGICAGGLLAGDAPCNNLDLTGGKRFNFYAVVNQGIHKTNVMITGIGTNAVEHYWEDGPQFTGWGSVVGRYPNGTPAIVEGMSGKGWVILSGVHPEAPDRWRKGMPFTQPTSTANTQAVSLIGAALNATPLPHF